MSAAADQPGAPLLEFAEVMRRLRAECPWKAGQTHRSLARYLLEETYETLEALDTGDAEHLREELGDLLLQVYFHGVIAEQEGEFTLDDIARDITAKMIRRNPHVFGDAAAQERPTPADAAAVNDLWEQRKAAEKARSDVTEGLPEALPALLYADKLLDRLARAGRPVPSAAPAASAAAGETSGDTAGDTAGDTSRDDPAVELGDRLLALVAEGRASGTDPEQALRDACRRLLDSEPTGGSAPGASSGPASEA